ncbi:MAG: hypothetical protein MRY83_13750, partial [Flavobacteriales bacterium]|nr:hypothetical protein [Flavobacteriales bacterium]
SFETDKTKNLSGVDFLITPLHALEPFFGNYGRSSIGFVAGAGYRKNESAIGYVINYGLKSELDFWMMFTKNCELKKKLCGKWRFTVPVEFLHGVGQLKITESTSLYNEYSFKSGLGLAFSESWMIEVLGVLQRSRAQKSFFNDNIGLNLRLAVIINKK